MGIELRRVCVFCGSSFGRRHEYLEAARAVGTLLAREGITLVYGGASVGLMTAVADSALDAGGEVIGVIPDHLADVEIAHKGLTELHVVDSMLHRKALMLDLSDAFIVLPGGLGTLEELFEVAVGNQLGLHRLPVGLLNVDGFFDPLLTFLDRAVADKLLKRQNLEMLLVDSDLERLLGHLRSFEHNHEPKWLDS